MKKIKNKLYLNILSTTIYEIIAIISGFIVPKLILQSYGSTINGLVSSIEQSLSFFVLTDMGIGAVVLAALYEPLSQKDNLKISKIVCSGQKFFNKMGTLLIFYVLILVQFYTLQVKEFDFLYISVLIFAIAANSFANYFFGRTSMFLLQADQKIYITMSANCISYITNILVCVLLIKMGASIQLFKWISALVLIIQPIVLKIYVQKCYHLKHVSYTEEPIKQKWNGISHHIASVVFNNTDTIILTLCSTLENVSVYAVYSIVVRGILRFVTSTLGSLQSYLGVLFAERKMHELREKFNLFETIMHIYVTALFGCTAVLIVPFINVYTKNITDYNYSVPLFGFLLAVAYLVYSYKQTYYVLILAAGHFKETQNSLWIEVSINTILSVILVYRFGLIGVAIGTLAAMIYQTFYFVWYTSKNILRRSKWIFCKHLFIDVLSIFTITFICKEFSMITVSYLSWAMLAIKVLIVSIIILFILNGLFFRNELLQLLKSKMQRPQK